jgi:5-oxoprolinase (ATP-hydrolysing) subunit A
VIKRIDLNADVGEGLPADQERELLRAVTSASIACGFHAGDRATMRQTLAVAGELGVRAGAHPSYPDRENFGRVSVPMRPDSLIDCIGEQVSMLQEAALESGMRIAYLKPHGALYNDAALDEAVARSIATAAALLGLPIMLLAGAPTLSRLPGDSPRVFAEGFVDRGYREDGTLVPRTEAGALIADPAAAAAQAVRVAASVDSLCIHSDSPAALRLARAARAALESSGYEIGP